MTATDDSAASPRRCSTGIAGLDNVLNGGFPPDRVYLVEGDPGTGKTTLGFQFLLDGIRRGEEGLFVCLSETASELRSVAATHGWDCAGLAIHELSDEDGLAHDAEYTVFHPAEVELGGTMRSLFDAIERVKPRRVVVDSLTEMRLLARDPLRYRRQILSLKQFFTDHPATVLLLDDMTGEAGDRQLHSLAHGVVRLEQLVRAYGPARRRLQVIKLRGASYREGLHDFVIRRGGIQLYPRLVAAEHETDFSPHLIASGVPGLDALLGGGLAMGSTVLMMGPAGIGKSLLASQYAVAAAHESRRVAFFLFDEERKTLLAGTAGVGIDVAGAVDAGRASLRAANPGELSPGEFAHLVRSAVEQDGAQVVVMDSLNGYGAAMPEEQLVDAHLREMFSYLRHRGVLTIVTMAQHGIIGTMSTTVDVSYLADTVLLGRFFEANGAIRRAVSVMKRRGGAHENTIRELVISSAGIHVGSPLLGFQGVLTGVPHIVGEDVP